MTPRPTASREDALVRSLVRGLPAGPDVIAGPGDDCAVVGSPAAKTWTLLKTDAVIEGVHFLPQEKPARVGWKALCRAISDIAAMGGTPRHALVTVAVPTGSAAWLRSLYVGLRKAARTFGVDIVGGETARLETAKVVSIALTGDVPRRQCVRRGGGRAGDALFVTGRLGGSLAGRHLDFTPRLAEARWLAEHFTPSAMMDLSDGLAADLPRLAAASGCGWRVELDAIPRTPGCDLAQAVGDGEDFELLFSIAPALAEKLPAAWARQFPKLPLTRIGELTLRGKTKFPARGYDHFSKP